MILFFWGGPKREVIWEAPNVGRLFSAGLMRSTQVRDEGQGVYKSSWSCRGRDTAAVPQSLINYKVY